MKDKRKKVEEKVNRRTKAEGEEEEITITLITINRRKSKKVSHLIMVVNKKIQDQLEAGHRHRTFEEIADSNRRKFKKRISIKNKKRYLEMTLK
jgi:hypothetical protein